MSKKVLHEYVTPPQPRPYRGGELADALGMGINQAVIYIIMCSRGEMGVKNAKYHKCGRRNDSFVLFREYENRRTFAPELFQKGQGAKCKC
jgi:hypothetical protein